MRRGLLHQSKMRVEVPLDFAKVLQQRRSLRGVQDQRGQDGLAADERIGQVRNCVLTEEGKCLTVCRELVAGHGKFWRAAFFDCQRMVQYHKLSY